MRPVTCIQSYNQRLIFLVVTNYLVFWADNWQFGVINCSLVIFFSEVYQRVEYASLGRGVAEEIARR